jgi:citrate lyase subunit beta/citryl-CoA lyase
MASSYRPRRTCLAVPGSNPRFLDKARSLPVDEIFLDLEDAVAPGAKPAARAAVVAALNGGGWAGQTRAVRINDATTPWAYRDVIEVVEGAGPNLDVIILPKASEPAQVSWLDLLLSQVDPGHRLERGRIGIEAQIEEARGLAGVNAIAAASGRLEALVFGPADFMASIGMRSLQVGAQPAGYTRGDSYHYARMRILVSLRWSRRPRAARPGWPAPGAPPGPQPSTPQAVSASARPLVRVSPARSAGLTQRASAASSPAASVPPVTVAA